MLRFVLVHYLALYTALVPSICCCIAPSNVNAPASISDSEQSNPTCCCQRHVPHSKPKPSPSPIKPDRKECPCESGKTFLASVNGSSQNDATSRVGYDKHDDRVLSAGILTLKSHANLNLHYPSLSFLNSCSQSSVEILRAKCVLLC